LATDQLPNEDTFWFDITWTLLLKQFHLPMKQQLWHGYTLPSRRIPSKEHPTWLIITWFIDESKSETSI